MYQVLIGIIGYVVMAGLTTGLVAEVSGTETGTLEPLDVLMGLFWPLTWAAVVCIKVVQPIAWLGRWAVRRFGR
jgi:hypothetical protein